MTEPGPKRLSDEGMQRREQMLGELLVEVDRVRGARVRRNNVVLATGAIVLCALAVRVVVTPNRIQPQSRQEWVERGRHEGTEAQRHESNVPSGTTGGLPARAESSSPRFISIVRTDPTVVSRLSVTDEPLIASQFVEQSRGREGGNLGVIITRVGPDEHDALELIDWLDDRALMDVLASINRPTGLIRIGNTVRPSRPVSDAALAMVFGNRGHLP